MRRYVHGREVDERLVYIDYPGGSAVTNFYYTDRSGSTVAMTDANGAVIPGQQYRYSPYGISGTEGDGGNPFRYTGRRLDAETGLYYYRARYYSPHLGRFLQTDPIGYGDGMNMYAYTRNDPMNGTDPTGLLTCLLLTYDDVPVANLGCYNDVFGPLGFFFLEALSDSTTIVNNNENENSDAENADIPASDRLVSKGDNQPPSNDPEGPKNPLPVPAPPITAGDGPSFDSGRDVVQTGGNKLNKETARKLNEYQRKDLKSREIGRGLEELKSDMGLPNNHHGKILRNGDYVDADNGVTLGNIWWYLP